MAEDEKDARLAELQALLEDQQQAFNAQMVGQTRDVLFERAGRHPGQLVGRTPYNQAVHVATEDFRVGDVAKVAIDSCKPHSLEGRIADTATATAASEERLSA